MLTHLPHYAGGLAPIANGLLHQDPGIQSHVLDILLSIDQYPVCPLVAVDRPDKSHGVTALTCQVGHIAISQMNYYHRSLFFREAEKRSLASSQSQDNDHPSPSHHPSYQIDTTPQQQIRTR